MTIWLGEELGFQATAHFIVLVFWLGVGLGIVAWLKVKVNKPSFVTSTLPTPQIGSQTDDQFSSWIARFAHRLRHRHQGGSVHRGVPDDDNQADHPSHARRNWSIESRLLLIMACLRHCSTAVSPSLLTMTHI